MKAVQLVAPRRLEVVEIALPHIGDDEVLLQVAAAGLCHSDIHVRHTAEVIFPLPLTLGHETAGHVVEVGSKVTNWSVGDAALVHLIWACGRCSACARGADNVCHAAGRTAMPPTPGLGPPGGMAEFMAVPTRYLVPLGDLDPVSAAPLADAGMTPYHAIRNSLDVLSSGTIAVVIGVGGLGHLAVQILRRLTPASIVAIDIAAERLIAARHYGADKCFQTNDDTVGAVLELAGGRGAEAVFDFVGNQQTVELATAIVAPDGVCQLVGIGGGQVPIAAEPRFGQGWPYGATLRTSYGGTKSDLLACVALAAQGQLSVEVDAFPLVEAITAFHRLEHGKINGRAVLIP